jgi:large subunit ribosomal protein L29
MNMNATEIRSLTTPEIEDRLNEAREELMRLRFRQATGELTDTSQLRLTSRTIARISTILNERERVAQMEGEK